jgi:(1->4)-alpha-D-glucan 1-alpha-D-glucosylmutase
VTGSAAADATTRGRAIRATYRLQLRPGFGFDEVAELAGYLADLGVSHVYTSPYLQAAPGSSHGYDVVDPRRLNAELGGEPAFRRMVEALGRAGLGHVVDVVPNHMSIAGSDNPWWWDVLENGPASRYAAFFDVDWEPPEARLRNRILLPVLGDHYGRVLEARDIGLVRRGADFRVRFHDREAPVAPESLAPLLADAAARAGSDRLALIADGLADLPSPEAGATTTGARADRALVERRHAQKARIGAELRRVFETEAASADAVDAVLAEANADPDRLHELLEAQNYRLAYWRAADRDLGYRRFFDVSTLVALRMEDERVFRETHELLIRLIAEGAIDGVRIDHPDGLRDPLTYLERFRLAANPGWTVVEKILEPGETLRRDWPVDGTTGYDFLNLVTGLFVDRAGCERLTDAYVDYTGETRGYAEVAREGKRLASDESLGADVARLTGLWLEVCERHRRQRDFTRHELHEALIETLASFPVYRTYVRADGDEVDAEDIRFVEAATDDARTRRPDLDPELFRFLADILLLRAGGGLEAEFVMRFQQLSGPVMAKGVEDTAFYRYNRLLALNEVGGDPGTFGVDPEAFHAAQAARARDRPRTMVTTSTHDTKRSEDVRARLVLLSEIPDRWSAAVEQWSAITERYRTDGSPDRNDLWLLLQTLVGAWPIGPDRFLPYVEKALRESKRHTSWSKPEAAYERAARVWAASALADSAFVAVLEAFVDQILPAARVTSLAQVLLKLTSPGVPDVYQGTELWDLSLVDPDNRRPVDFVARRGLLRESLALDATGALDRTDDGLAKLWLIRRALAVRAEHPSAFDAGASYEPLAVRGRQARHVVAFARVAGDGSGATVTVVPRLVLGLEDGWEDTAVELPARRWRDGLGGMDRRPAWTGGWTAVAELLARFPVALLVAHPVARRRASRS